MKQLRVLLLHHPWMGCLFITVLPPTLNSPVPIYTPGWREALWEWNALPKNTTQWLEPGPLNAEANTPTMRPPLHNKTTPKWKIFSMSLSKLSEIIPLTLQRCDLFARRCLCLGWRSLYVLSKTKSQFIAVIVRLLPHLESYDSRVHRLNQAKQGRGRDPTKGISWPAD